MRRAVRPLVAVIAVVGSLLLAHAAVAHEAIRSGPMVGFSEIGAAELWLQTTRPARVQLRLWRDGASGDARLSPEVATAEAEDLIARFRFEGLEPGGDYRAEVFVDGRLAALPHEIRVRSQPIWRYRTPPPDVRLAFGSCAYFNDPPFDRPGEPYGGDPKIFPAILATRPDLMLWLGDDVYYREGDLGSEAAMRRRWAHDRATPELQALLGGTHHYAIWDDHDFGPNDSDRTFRDREAALRIFRDYWANPSYGTAETPGVFGRFAIADVELFLLDDRYHRAPNRSPDGPDKRMFGREQLAWLEEALASSDATFKIVAAGNQMWNPITAFEAFGKYPTEQRELLDFLRRARIPGLLFLTGDRHHTELLAVDVPGLYRLYEYTSSPLTSGLARSSAKETDNPARIAGTFVTDRRNFGLIDVSGPEDARVLTLRALDADGREIWQHRIAAKELAPREPTPRR